LNITVAGKFGSGKPTPIEATSPVRARPGRRPFYTRIRFQLPVGLLICVLLPAWLRMHHFVPDFMVWRALLPAREYSALYNGAIGATAAIIAGYFLMRRFNSFPGVQPATSLLTAYSVPFGLVIAAFLLFRFDYCRFLFVTSYGLSLIWFGGLHLATERVRSRDLFLVPGGHADSLTNIDLVNWIALERPPRTTRGISAVAADLRHDHPQEWQRFLCDCALAGVPVYHHKQLAESMTGRLDIQHLSENTFGSVLPDLLYLRIKHLVDFLVAVVLFPFFLLLLLVLAPLIVAGSPGPVFFRQERIGYGGKRFTIYKFRTMAEGPAMLSLVEAAETGSRDKPITGIGYWLRKFRVDEVPQIINILRGEMSWIGPRPEALALSQWYEAQLPFYRYRHTVRPGISGWAQVNQGHVASADEVLEKLHYDFYYIKHISPSLDLLILLRTIKTVLTGFGSR
jgi:lipopolysaccharide/colanic/teichoic acid biosynthesis glycosyltransferase